METNLYALYRHPPVTATETYRVWCEAQIPAEATVHDIAVLLDDWVRTYCSFSVVNGVYHIGWRSPTGVVHDIPFDAIVHWILCAAVPVKPAQPVSSPPLAPVSVPVPAPNHVSSSSDSPVELASDELSSLSLRELEELLSDPPSEPKFVPESKPAGPRPDTPRPFIETPLPFM
jgi:hypothetical protein